MNINDILFILFSIIIAGCLSFFYYLYKVNNKSKTDWVLAFLRFLSILGILLLFINPVITRKMYKTNKTPLVVVLDNSKSIREKKAEKDITKLLKKISETPDLQKKFQLHLYKFDTNFSSYDTLNFKGNQSKLDLVGKNLKQIYKNTTCPVVLLTDGNQTSGNDYVYSFDKKNHVYPIILGDTTSFLDLKISRLNVNKYAVYKNKFTVEIFLNYSGNKNLDADFKIMQDKKIINHQKITFSHSKKNIVLKVLLPAEKLGTQTYKAVISSDEKEKNSYNNIKNFAVEIIDKKTEIAIFSSINHPDIGAIKRALESKEYQKVSVLKPSETDNYNNYNVLILYQPQNSFKKLFEKLQSTSANIMIITGNHTDFNFLNQQQNSFVFKMSNQSEDFLVDFNPDFNLFLQTDIGFENFPPLQNIYGNISQKSDVSILLNSKIRNVKTNMPLLAFSENLGKRQAFLFGENIWKWRLQTFLDKGNFVDFDVFINKTVQFLMSNDLKKSLVVSRENFYTLGDEIEIEAKYFNKNLEFDEKARLNISIINQGNKKTSVYDFTKSDNSFKIKLPDLSFGKYQFKVTELNTNTVYSGGFEVIDFDIEKQFTNPDLKKLTQLAAATQGEIYFPDQIDALVKKLLKDENYKDIEKEVGEQKPLIDWIWLLAIIIFCLSLEWFFRKSMGKL